MSNSYYDQFLKLIAEKDGKVINDKQFNYILDSFTKYTIEFKKNMYTISYNFTLGENMIVLLFPESNIVLTCSYNTAKCMSFVDAILEQNEFSFETKIIKFQYFDTFLKRLVNSPKIIIVTVPLNAIIISLKSNPDYVEEIDTRYSPMTQNQVNYESLYYDSGKNINLHKLLYFKL